MNDAKMKRWGWGAIIGLIGVILVAGLVIAVSLSSPKPTADESVAIETVKTEDTKKDDSAAKKQAEEKKAADEKKKAEEQAAADAKAKAAAEAASTPSTTATTTGNMPKTGPLDTTVAVLGMSVAAYLAALNLGLIKKRA